MKKVLLGLGVIVVGGLVADYIVSKKNDKMNIFQSFAEGVRQGVEQAEKREMEKNNE